MLFDASEEAPGVKGLGIIPGEVRKLTVTTERLPHMGWNTVEIRTGSVLFDGIDDGSWLYFVHSYAPVPDDEAVVAATTEYGGQRRGRRRAGLAVGDAVPPGEERRQRAAAAEELRRCLWLISTRPSTCGAGGPSACCGATTRPRPCTPTTRWPSPGSFEAAGARWIHVVDLDAARSGEAGNLEYVAAIARSVALRGGDRRRGPLRRGRRAADRRRRGPGRDRHRRRRAARARGRARRPLPGPGGRRARRPGPPGGREGLDGDHRRRPRRPGQSVRGRTG